MDETTGQLFDSKRVVEIAGAYGSLCSAIEALNVVAMGSFSKADYMGVHDELKDAVEAYRRIVPEGLRDPIIQTQGQALSMQYLDKLLEEDLF